MDDNAPNKIYLIMADGDIQDHFYDLEEAEDTVLDFDGCADVELITYVRVL